MVSFSTKKISKKSIREDLRREGLGTKEDLSKLHLMAKLTKHRVVRRFYCSKTGFSKKPKKCFFLVVLESL